MIPHFDIPFQINGSRGAIVVDQDSPEEIMNCVETILRYQQGVRPEAPEFGIPDVTFSSPVVNVTTIQQALIDQEPRIAVDVETPVVNNLIQSIVVEANFERN